jgi:superfamily I DNA and/or RNA helicase
LQVIYHTEKDVQYLQARKTALNLFHLLAFQQAALEKGLHFVGIKKSSNDDSIYDERYMRSENKNEKIPMDALLLAGTSWLFSDERFEQHLAFLFIEEAGQVSLANVVAMGTSAKNIILAGDHMQLSQPKQGVHPGDAGKSILEYLLGEHATIPPERGIFLNKTWRFNLSICKFISQAFYDGRLEADSSNDKRLLVFHNPIRGIIAEGIHIIPATHANCSQKSEEEGVVIKNTIRN